MKLYKSIRWRLCLVKSYSYFVILILKLYLAIFFCCKQKNLLRQDNAPIPITKKTKRYPEDKSINLDTD